MTHAEIRVQERLTKAQWSTEDQAKLSYAAKALAVRTSTKSEAIRLAVLKEQVGQAYGQESNGNEVWAIYRNQQLITVMLRRSNQADAKLRVAVVNRLV